MIRFFRKHWDDFPIYDETKPLTAAQIEYINSLGPPIIVQDTRDYTTLKRFMESFQDSDGEEKAKGFGG